MGWIEELYRLIDEDNSPAMEASEDITGEVESQTSKVLGDDNDISDNNGEISLNTDDILGTREDNLDNQDTDTDDTAEETPPEEDGEEDLTKDQSNDELPSESPDLNTPENVMDEKEDPFSASRKKKIWQNFRAFYDSLEDSSKLIAQYVPNTSDANTIRALDNIRDNLLEAKDMIYQILTRDFQSMSYPDLQKKYIGLNHIYDLCTKELEVYFDKYHDKS